MDAKRRQQYGQLTQYLEEPIRELVPPTWDLPYVVDMGFTCSGHILRGNSWYPHRAMLEFAFSLDEDLVAARDAFRKDLAAVLVQVDGLKLGFDDVRAFEKDCLPYSRIPGQNLSENYTANIPEVPKEVASVERVEALLTSFWEAVADVVRKHNPDAEIGPVEGKSFRRVINWAHWRGVFFKEE